MKIDLHLHNKKVSVGEPETRNIQPEEFKNILKEAGIGIAAITNHNYFDDDVYNNYIDEEYLLLPGMEIDILDENNERKQLNVIVSVENASWLKGVSNNQLKDVNENKPIKLDEFIAIFKDIESIIFLDHKGHKTQVGEEMAKQIKEKMKNAVIIYDANDPKTHRILLAHNYETLIGSDVKDWNDYVEKDSVNLISSNIKFNNFDLLYKLLIRDAKILNQIIDTIDEEEISVCIESDTYDIKLLAGLNVIIGDKATGKTRILEKMHNHKIEGGVASSIYLADKKEQNFKEILTVKKESKNAQSFILDIKEKIDQLLNQVKPVIPTPSDVKNMITSKHNSSIKINEIKLGPSKKVEYSKIKAILIKIDETITELKKYKNQDKNNLEIITKYIEHTDKLTKKLKSNFIEANRKMLSHQFLSSILKGVCEVTLNTKGFGSSNLSVKLFDTFFYRKKFLENKLEIANSDFNERNEISKFSIPDVGEVSMWEVNELTKFNDRKIQKVEKSGHSIKDWKEFVVPFFEEKEYSEINKNKFKKYWEENNSKKIINTKRFLLDENQKNFNPSSGQKSLIILLDVLNKDSKIYFLDEPAVHLGSNMAMSIFNKKISSLKKEGKTIVIATHNANIGINSIPTLYIFRKKDGDVYKTYYANIASDCFVGDGDEIKFNDVILPVFEGGEDALSFRKGIYDNKNRDKR